MKRLLPILLLLSACGPKDGAQGPEGVQGPAGANVDNTYAVQLCPSIKGHYPDKFPEQGLCIDNMLYAVYWDGDNAWLAPLYPGTYVSTATGLGCTIEVVIDCIVKQL